MAATLAAPPITEAERLRRLASYNSALTSLRLEGIELDSDAKQLFERYVAGEFSRKELHVELDRINERDFGPVRLSQD